MLQIIAATTKPPTSTSTPLFYHNPSVWHEQPEVVLDGESQATSRISRRGAHDKMTPEREQKKQSKFHTCCSLCYSNCSHALKKKHEKKNVI